LNLDFKDRTEEIMMLIAVIKFLSNALKIIAMGFFGYSAYKGTFSTGNSTTVFIGVAVLTVVIVITHIIDDIRR
jgi:uncharacterized membrane protein